MTTLLLAGATGLVGGNALGLLLADERATRIVAPTRRPLAPHPRLFNPIADSGTLPPDADWFAVDGAICDWGRRGRRRDRRPPSARSITTMRSPSPRASATAAPPASP